MATRYVLEQGVTYLIKEPKPDDSLKIFASLVKQGAPGFCITRVHPKRIRKRFELGDTPIVWITTSEVADEKCVHPSDLAKLNMAINDMLKNRENLAILLEGIEYLVTYNGFDSILRFVQVINDRIMVTNSRFIITLDPATLDSSSLHILERDLTPVEDLAKLEITFSEFPDAAAVTGDRWRAQYEEKLRKWQEKGYKVGSLEPALKAGREEAEKAFELFEAVANRAASIEEELRSMDLGSFRTEADGIRSKLLDPATVKGAEDELLALQVSVERRKKDDQRRTQDEGRLREDFRNRLKEWTAQGYNTGQLSAAIDGPADVLRKDFERFENAIRKLQDLNEELLLMDVSGFESEVEGIRSRLMSPARVSEVEDDIFRLKILIERRRKEERRKNEEDERARTDMQARLAQWKAEGYNTYRLDGWENLAPAQARSRFEAFEKDVGTLKDLDSELAMVATRGLEDEVSRIRKMLSDADSIPMIRTGLLELKSRMEKGQDENRRRDFERKIEEWKVLGYNTDRLRQLEHADPDTIQKELVVFKIRVHRLKELEGELSLLDSSGFPAEVGAIQPLFKDVDRISEVESKLTELRIKLKNRSEEMRRKREDSGRRKRELLDRMSVWLSQGYSVARLEELLDREPDLDKLERDFDRFERDIVRLKELAGRMRTLDISGFEKDAAGVQDLMSDISKVKEAEEALSALEERMKQGREDARRQATEEEKRKRKAQERIQAWKDQGLNVSGLEGALERGLEAFKKELSLYNLKLEKLKGIREELSLLDARGLEPELESLRVGLKDVDNAGAAEEGLRALRARIEERKEKERRDRETDKEERRSYIQKLLNWSSQGLVVENLEKAIDQPIGTLRSEFERYEAGLRRLDEVRRTLVSLDLTGFEDEADRLRLKLNDPEDLDEVEHDILALNARLEARDREKEEAARREGKRSEVRKRLQKMAAVPINVSRMDKFLDSDLEVLQNEFDIFLEDVKRLRELRKRFTGLDIRGFEGPAGELEGLLRDPDTIPRIEEALDRLESDIEHRRATEKARRDELDAQVEGWAKGGVNVEMLRGTAALDLPAYEKAVGDFEHDLEDYRRTMEKLMKFEHEYIRPPVPVAEKVGGEAGAPEGAPGEEEARSVREVEREVAEEVVRIKRVAPGRPSPEARIRMEQRLRSEHRAMVGRLAERKRRRFRNRVSAAAVAVMILLTAYLVAAYVLAPAKSSGFTIDGGFQDWQSTAKVRYPQTPGLPENIDIRETALASEGGKLFCFLRTWGTIMKGSINSSSGIPEGDWLGIYFDTDSTLSTGLQIEGIGADHMVFLLGWDNVVQDMHYRKYNASNPLYPWEWKSARNTARSFGDRLEVMVDPALFGDGVVIDRDLLVFELHDSHGNVDVVR